MSPKPFSIRNAANREIDEAIVAAREELRLCSGSHIPFMALIDFIRWRTSLMNSRDRAFFFIRRLRNVALRRGSWLRPIETWIPPRDQSVHRSFHALATHLFCEYETPRFMDSAWADYDARQQGWFIDLGRGAKLRALDLPIPLTQRMEHFARQAPDHFSPIEALRYGEILGLGGSEHLARQVLRTRLARNADNSDFWRSVVIFLINHPSFPVWQIWRLIDFLQAIKFSGERILTPSGLCDLPPVMPDFSMKGRTVESLLRIVQRLYDGDLVWQPSGIAPFLHSEEREGARLEWSIVELLNSAALYAEGRAMSHCVSTYALDCRDGDCFIFSLRLRINEKVKSMATIEVDARTRSIRQFKARRNAPPGASSHRVMRRWAEAQKLGLALN